MTSNFSLQAHYFSLGFPDCPLAARITRFIEENLNGPESAQMASMLQKAVSSPPSVLCPSTFTSILQLSHHLWLFLLQKITVTPPASTKLKLQSMTERILTIFDIEVLSTHNVNSTRSKWIIIFRKLR